MLAALLPVCGPVLLMSAALCLSFAVAGAPLEAAVAGGLALMVPAAAAAACLGLLYRWCFPQADTRPAGLAAALLVLLLLLSSGQFLSSLSSPVLLGADGAHLLVAARELALVGGLALVAVMGTVLLVEIPVRFALAGWSGPSQESALRSMRCVASFLIVSAAWLLLEESATERLAQLRQLLVR